MFGFSQGGFDEALVGKPVTNDVIHIYVAAFPNMAMSFLFQSNLQISDCHKRVQHILFEIFSSRKPVWRSVYVQGCSAFESVLTGAFENQSW
jgi:hypothetical protein